MKSHEVVKSANLLFSTLDPSYVWIHCGYLLEKACQSRVGGDSAIFSDTSIGPVGKGMPNLMEVCALTEFLLETVSLDAFADTPCEHLPGLFYEIINKLSSRLEVLSPIEISTSLGLCGKILSKVQPTVVTQVEKTSNELEGKNEIGASLGTAVNTGTTNVTDGDLVPVIPLEKSQSDSKLNKPQTSNGSFIERSPSPRRRANSGGAPKKSEKKSRKKSSKSVSRLNEVAQDTRKNSANIAVVVSTDETKQKSVDDSSVEYKDRNAGENSTLASAFLSNTLSPMSPMGSTASLSRGASPALQAQHTMLEKCLRQYKSFYVKLVSERILGKNAKPCEMFETLVIPCPKESIDERTKQLELLLSSRLSLEDSGYFNQDVSTNFEAKSYPDFLNNLHVHSIVQSDWESVLKIASTLLVELSTFPTYFTPGDGIFNEIEEPKKKIVLPDWLKVLVVCACWLGKQPSLQVTSIATLLDLIALSKAHSDVESHPQSGEGVTAVVMVPLLKEFHVSYLKQYTNVFQVRNSLAEHNFDKKEILNFSPEIYAVPKCLGTQVSIVIRFLGLSVFSKMKFSSPGTGSFTLASSRRTSGSQISHAMRRTRA